MSKQSDVWFDDRDDVTAPVIVSVRVGAAGTMTMAVVAVILVRRCDAAERRR